LVRDVEPPAGLKNVIQEPWIVVDPAHDPLSQIGQESRLLGGGLGRDKLSDAGEFLP
jgi:hypothetical protein